MKKELAYVSRQGSWGWFIFWLIFFFPIAIGYWILRMKKTKTYKVKNK